MLLLAMAGGSGGLLYMNKDAILNYQFPKKQEKQVPVDYQKVRQEVADILERPEGWDGHNNIGPILVRLGWHASGTYDRNDKTGGSNGSTMRFSKEAKDGANAGLQHAQKFLEPIKEKNPGLSYADLWVLASYVAIEEMGGPKIEFVPGRKDAQDENSCPPNGRLPDAGKGRSHIREVFYRMGFNDREIVALIGGGHALGKCHPDRSGYDGPWTNAPTLFSNLYFKELLENTWSERKWNGPRQFEDKTKKLMMLPADMEIRDDPDFKRYAQMYKDDKNLFFNDFAAAFKKLTELGFKTF